MLTIFTGDSSRFAGDIQRQIETHVIAVEHSPLMQERQSGAYDFQDRLETGNEMFRRLAAENGVTERVVRQLFPGEQPSKRILIGEIKRGRQIVAISPAVRLADDAAVTLDNFPDEWSFGNGVTCNATVRLSDEELHTLSWVVFPDAAEVTVLGQFGTLQALIE